MTSFRTQRHFSQSSLALKHASGTALTFQPQQYLSPSRLISNRALGGIPQKFPDLATAKKVNIDFPYAAAQNFTSLLGPELRSKNAKFRFVYVSGKAADRGLEKQHRWFHDARHIKGVIETKLLEFESQNADIFKAYLPRPGSVIPRNSMFMTVLGAVTRPIYPDLKVEELAAAMIGIAVNGGYEGEGENTILHEELQTKGRELFGTAK